MYSYSSALNEALAALSYKSIISVAAHGKSILSPPLLSPQSQRVGGVQKNLALMPPALQWKHTDWG